jgi:UDP-N-acetylmuramyl tripeptide synthase
VVTYAIKDRDADVYAEKVKLSQWESDIIIRTPLGRLQVAYATVGIWFATLVVHCDRHMAAHAAAPVVKALRCRSCLQIITPLIGRPNVYNVLAAVAVGISLNVNLKVVCFLIAAHTTSEPDESRTVRTDAPLRLSSI